MTEKELVQWTVIYYSYLRELGKPGEVVITSFEPWLQEHYDLTRSRAHRIRRETGHEIRRLGLAERLHPNSRRVLILA